jgi:hypothetical protein
MDWGKANRMSKLILGDQHCFYLAMDHGYFQGCPVGMARALKAVIHENALPKDAYDLFMTVKSREVKVAVN